VNKTPDFDLKRPQIQWCCLVN